jgi:hypothetical protein
MTILQWVTPLGTIANLPLNVPAVPVQLQAYSTANVAEPLTYQLTSGSLPSGLALQANGLVTGTPVFTSANAAFYTSRTYDFTVQTIPTDPAAAVTSGALTGGFSIIITTNSVSEITWVTPGGALGTIPYDQFYSLPLLTVDQRGGTVFYKFTSGKLPPGMQITLDGKIQGTPQSVEVADPAVAQTFRFTVRAYNNNNQVNDRAFTITVSGISTPIISPTVRELPSSFDGDFYNQQLTVLNTNTNVPITWSNIGALPPGLTLSNTGVISGYVLTLQLVGAWGPAGYDGAQIDPVSGAVIDYHEYNFGPYDFNQLNQGATYSFQVRAYDGVSYALQNYSIQIVTRSTFTADNEVITVDDDTLTIDRLRDYEPVVLNTERVLPAGRQDSYYAYKINGYDFQGDTVSYNFYNTVGTFDAFVPRQDVGFDQQPFDNYAAAVGGFSTLTAPTWRANTNTTTQYVWYANVGEPVGNTYTVTGNVYAPYFANVIASGNVAFSFAGNTYTIPTPSQLPGIGLDSTSGWLYGKISTQSTPLETYRFGILVTKIRDSQIYYSKPAIFELPVLGGVNNVIVWNTPRNLGTINNGTISEFSIEAVDSLDSVMYYSLYDAAGVSVKLPQGLQLLPSGLITGRVSFEVFTIDTGATTFDNDTLSIDKEFKFTVKAITADNSQSSTKEFVITLTVINLKPYDNLYLKALPSLEQRRLISNTINNPAIFDPDLIYRPDDPWFGISAEIKMLFLYGLDPDTLATYQTAMRRNHFTKTYNFGDIKTASVLDSSFNTKYEVVYVEVQDPGLTEPTIIDPLGTGPGLEIQLNNANRYIDENGIVYDNIAYPNSSNNMRTRLVDGIGFADQSSLPDWMTSNQPDPTSVNRFKTPLGYTRGVVLAYTKPNASKLIAYRLSNSNLRFSDIAFTVDRYQIDNYYSTNFDPVTNTYITGRETTFDLTSAKTTGRLAATVGYAVTVPFNSIHGKTVDYLNSQVNVDGQVGIDGETRFRDGETLIFAKQEKFNTGEPSDGWIFQDVGFFGDSISTPQFDGYSIPEVPYDSFVGIPGYYEAKQAINPVQTFTVSSITVYSPTNNFVTVSSTSGIVEGSPVIFTSPLYPTVYANTTTGTPLPGAGTIFAGNAFYNIYYVTNVIDSTHINLGVGRNPALANVPFIGTTVTGSVFANQRAGVWRISIINGVVNLTFEKNINLNDRVAISGGRTYGGGILIYSGTIRSNQTVPAYEIYQYDPSVGTKRTTFNGDSTRFFSYRDQFYNPGSQDKYVKFPQNGVFN